MTAHDIFAWLEAAIKDKKSLLLSPDQCKLLLGWANEVTEHKNRVVRENHALVQKSPGPLVAP